MIIPFKGFKTNQEKIKFVDQFFNSLLQNQNYFCKTLFEFIQFDVQSRQEIKINNEDKHEW